jgi:hypothetical protein
LPTAAREIEDEPLTAKVVADMLGITKQAVYIQAGKFGGRRIRGEWVFSRTLIEDEIERRSKVFRPQAKPEVVSGQTQGETASVVFSELRSGKTPECIVIEQKIAPEVVLKLTLAFARLRGCITLSGDDVEVLCRKMPGRPEAPKTTAELMDRLVDSIVPELPCRKCGKRTATYCPACGRRP